MDGVKLDGVNGRPLDEVNSFTLLSKHSYVHGAKSALEPAMVMKDARQRYFFQSKAPPFPPELLNARSSICFVVDASSAASQAHPYLKKANATIARAMLPDTRARSSSPGG